MHPAMFATIGEIVVFWSRIENSLDSDIRAMFQYRIVQSLADNMPHAFKKKLKLWRRCVRKLYPRIATYQAYADSFADAARKVSNIRNHIIHGTWNLEPDETGAYSVTNWKPVADGIEEGETFLVSQTLLNNLLTDVQKLDARITGFIASRMVHAQQGLLRADPAPPPENPAPQSGAMLSTREASPRSSPE